TRDRTVAEETIILFGEEVFALCRRDLRAVDGEQPLALSDFLVHRVCKYLLNPPGEPYLNPCELRFVDLDIAGGADFIAQGFVCDDAGLNAYALHALGCQLNRNQGGLRSGNGCERNLGYLRSRSRRGLAVAGMQPEVNG